MLRVQCLIAAYPFGRIVLHVACAAIDKEWAFHVAGILREFN